MFIRGAIGANRDWATSIDMVEERAAIEENWIKTGKMLWWHQFSEGLRVIGPPFQGKTESDGLLLEMYAFPTQELFMEWAMSPEHASAHTKLLHAGRAAMAEGRMSFPPVQYNFHATDDRTTDIQQLRGELGDLYDRMEQTEWAQPPAPGMFRRGMLGDEAE